MQERITVRMTDDMISRLDAWIASQNRYLSRQEVVRRCIEYALQNPNLLTSLRYDAPAPETSFLIKDRP